MMPSASTEATMVGRYEALFGSVASPMPQIAKTRTTDRHVRNVDRIDSMTILPKLRNIFA
jgi:hypothetical protein